MLISKEDRERVERQGISYLRRGGNEPLAQYFELRAFLALEKAGKTDDMSVVRLLQGEYRAYSEMAATCRNETGRSKPPPKAQPQEGLAGH